MVKNTFIIAEAGVNHNGNLKTALKLVDTAAAIGADAVKFQTFSAKKLVTATAPKAAYQKKNAPKSKNQNDMLARLELSKSDHIALIKRCRQKKILFLSSPFDEESADLLHDLKIPLFKVPSGEISNKALLQHIAHLGRPMIVSTGMCTLDDVKRAVLWIREANPKIPLTLLHCVTEYPAPFDQVNLKAMQTLSDTFHVPIGYSDHTPDIEIAIAAVALGATLIEKHFTLSQKMPGPDHKASLEPKAFEKMVVSIRRVEKALGDGVKRPMPCELANQKIARKSLVATQNLPAGTRLAPHHMTEKRPGHGLPPAMKDQMIGKVLKKSIRADTLFSRSHV